MVMEDGKGLRVETRRMERRQVSPNLSIKGHTFMK
jgi:hypothetical protein